MALPAINYALWQNGVPILPGLEIFVREPLSGVTLLLETQPALTLPLEKRFDQLPPGLFRPDVSELRLNGAYLAGLTERETGLLTATLSQGEQVLCREQVNLTVLAYDEWQGAQSHPELLSAFVTPNHLAIGPLIARAAGLLEEWTGDPSLDGYQSRDPNRVLAQAAAVYGALREQNLIYAPPPASFEETGQRVRLCQTVLEQKMGTCLDLTLLYCGCLEAMGLHPLVLLLPGHCFAGVWLEELSFPEAVQDDGSLITKRLASGVNEIAVVECTALTAGKNMDFDKARSAAEEALQGSGSVLIVDLRRARLSGVRPLPQRTPTAEGWKVERPEAREAARTGAPEQVFPMAAADAAGEEPTKLQQWERKLLDLGLRNNLISMRLSGSAVPILAASLDQLEDALAEGSDFSILPRPQEYVPGEGPAQTPQSCRELIASEFGGKRLRSAMTEGELNKAVKELYRASRSSLEENGANTLYLALGLLKWYESPRSAKARYAPLILLPVELLRRSVRQGYTLRLRDEDPQMNITLLEKMKQDFHVTITGLDPLPMDDKGVDSRQVFTVIRRAVMEQPRWDVVESAYLGIFSFSQFVMWNDLRNRAQDIVHNPLVKSLMEGRLAWEAEEMEIPQTVPEEGVLLPIPADASQLYAIRSAGAGATFVLHGPPGTGKSQTITALIANTLAQGKTVLFVAEKMAALEVVQRRLEAIGIGPFCLELHSNKSKKRDVLEQLRRATEVTKVTPPEAFGRKGEQLAQTRAQLDRYAKALHRTQPCGESLFTLINRYESLRLAPELPSFPESFLSGANAATLETRLRVLEQLVSAGQAIGHPHDHPLDPVGQTQYTQQLRFSLPQKIDNCRRALGPFRETVQALSDALGVPMPRRESEIRRFSAVAEELQAWLAFPRSWGKREEPEPYFRGVRALCAHLLSAQEKRDLLLKNWQEEFLRQDGAALARSWDNAAEKWLLPRLMAQNGLARRLAPFAKGKIDAGALREALALLAAYQREQFEAEKLAGTFGDEALFFESDPAAMDRAAQAAWDSAVKLDDALDARALRLGFAGDRAKKPVLEAYFAACKVFREAKGALDQALNLSWEDSENFFDAQVQMYDTLQNHLRDLKDYIAWNAMAETAANAKLGAVVDAYRAGLAHDQVLPAYQKTLAMGLARQAIDREEALRSFSGAVFQEQIRQFRKLDGELTRLTQQEIYCRLAQRVPSFAREAAQSSELGILQRAIRSGGRGVSIRRLLDQLPNLLPRLCPCMLMSPISAAQYLDPARSPFDLVVFDEASQLPTCKAVGVLARGNAAVIAGDPNQMPPTSFFASNNLDEDNLELEDLESILDDCLALNLPQTHLLWHYRSRHESLIAFSNAEFYENRLFTFPSVNDRVSKVRLVPVRGTFRRGKQRQNPEEAQAVVAELKRRCHDPQVQRQSVGVVTFNIQQQNLIDDLLSEECASDPELEAWAYHSPEPVFIKNLENVQGDERDVILFSIGYGPDPEGRISMNFGPLNRDGGWRRLNVAITRARQEMTVFTALSPEQLDLSRTSARGVAALRGFLEYAGRQSLPQNEETIQQAPADPGIAQAICDHLAGLGYQTQQAVGHSAYRIDIGVVDPEKPDTYRLGILLDGPGYRAAKTTRDRELAQQSVLEGLGWRIHRVWAMDWWDNRERELERIEELLKSPCPAPPEPAEEPTEPAPLLAQNAAPKKSGPPAYVPAALKATPMTAEEFLLPKNAPKIRKKLQTVVDKEAPISRSLLTRRVLQSCGISRAGSRVQSYLDGLIQEMGLVETSREDQLFYWAREQEPEKYLLYRVSATEEDRREAKDLPVQEAAAAVCQVLLEQISLSEEDLYREAAKLLGYARPGAAVTALLREAIAYAAEKGRIQTGANGCYVLTE